MKAKSTKTLFYSISSLIIALSFCIAISSSFRDYLADNIFLLNKRTVLSVLEYKHNSEEYKIIKIKIYNTLFVEVYDKNSKNISSFNLGKNLNGAIFLNGKTTELASYDLDNDKLQEVIIPTLSKNNKNLIFILKYDADSKLFSLESPISYLD